MVRTGVSGIAGTIVDVTTMICLVELAELAPGLAAFFGACAGAVASFTLAKFWAFKDPRPIGPKQVTAYALVALGTALFVATSVHVMADVIGLQYLLAKLISSSVVFLFWSYPAQSRLVFPRAHRRAAA